MNKISVVIPAYNAERFLEATLESALSQTFPPCEVIVVNDGSTDRTEEIALSFGSRIHYIKQQNQGLSCARNTGIAAAKGEWIALLDSDDLMTPDKLYKQARVIDTNFDLVLIYSAFTFLYPDGSTKASDFFPSSNLWPALRYRSPILPSTCIIRRAALLEVGGFRTLPAEDWDMWFRLIRRYSAAAFHGLPESLLFYRQWENNLSKRYLNMAKGRLILLDNLLLEDLSGSRKIIWKRKIEAKTFFNISVAMREFGDPRSWAFAIESFLSWPFGGIVMPEGRYRVLANMLYKRLLSSNRSFRDWWPKRSCRKDIENSQ